VKVSRSGGNNSQSERVYYSISGSATKGSDYSYLNSYIDIPAGSTTAYIPINPINDSIYEGTETVSINLQSSSAYNSGSSTSGMVYIYDNDPNISNILVFDSSIDKHLQTAVSGLGKSYQSFTDSNTFDQAIANANPNTTLVLISSPGLALSNWSNLTNFVNAGGRSLLSYWNLDANSSLASTFGASVTSDMFSSQPIYQWGGSTIFDGLGSSVGFSQDVWGDNGDRLQPLAGSAALAGFQSYSGYGQAASVLGNSGRTIVNGFLFDDVTVDSQAVQLAKNQIQLLMK
jgi:hypothetical protein